MEDLITLKRIELYNLVWSTPITKLSKIYSLSDKGLAKICNKMEIPIPPRGYWARKTAGYKVPIPSLPKLSPKGKEEYTLCPSNSNPNDKLSRPLNSIPTPSVPVPENLRSAHHFVKEYFQKYEKPEARYLSHGLIHSDEQFLSIKVSPQQLRRALRIMDAIIKYSEINNWKVSISFDYNEYKTFIFINEEPVGIQITEKLKMEKRVPKKGESYFWGGTDWVPTGNLILSISNTHYSGIRQNWRDSESHPLEEKLGSFILGMINASTYLKERRIEREREEKIRKEEEQRRQEEKRRRELELQAIQQLESMTSNWEKSQRILKFLDAIKNTRSQTPDPKLEEWLTWATTYAESLNPLPIDQSS